MLKMLTQHAHRDQHIRCAAPSELPHHASSSSVDLVVISPGIIATLESTRGPLALDLGTVWEQL